MAIEKQIWINMIMEGYYPDGSFLTRSVDMTENVEHNKINLAEAGVDPEVLIDNNTFPVPIAERTDSPIAYRYTRSTPITRWYAILRRRRPATARWTAWFAATATRFARRHRPLPPTRGRLRATVCGLP